MTEHGSAGHEGYQGQDAKVVDDLMRYCICNLASQFGSPSQTSIQNFLQSLDKMAAKGVKTFKLSTGQDVSAIGFGTWKSSPEDTYTSVKSALENGYRHIDTAWVSDTARQLLDSVAELSQIYGNEEDCGRAIKDSGVPRDHIFLTTKLWCTYHTRVAQNLEDSLKKLGVDYLDLYLMHWPVALNPNGNPETFPLKPDGTRDLQDRDFRETWKEMEKLKDSGKVRAIGVANFDIHNLEELKKSSSTVPVANQVELHPYLQQPKLHKYAQENGIHLTAYSPLGSSDSKIIQEPIIKDIAAAHNVDAGAVLLSWAQQYGHSAITKSVNPKRIKDNIAVFELSDEEMKKIASLDKGSTGRMTSPPWGVTVFHSDDL